VASVPDDWIGAMRRGDFARAWAITDLDLAARELPPRHTGPRHLQRIWRGERLAGKRVLVRCYHGLGDTIQFLRFMPHLRTIARHVTVWCQPELIQIVALAPGVDRAIPLHEGAPGLEYDVDIEIMEVPHAIKARRDQIEMREPYLVLPAKVRSPPAKAAGLAVGLVWEVGNWDKRRAIPAASLRCLALDGVSLHVLQRGAAAGQAAAIGAIDVSTPDVAALGHLIRQLDLVICVDTMVAHLAGALGCEAWVLLHADCDWRWPSSGSTSFWYPSLRLFHQKSAGDWDGVLGEVCDRLRARALSANGDLHATAASAETGVGSVLAGGIRASSPPARMPR